MCRTLMKSWAKEAAPRMWTVGMMERTSVEIIVTTHGKAGWVEKASLINMNKFYTLEKNVDLHPTHFVLQCNNN